MTNALRSAIADLASTLATSIVAAIRASNLEDILALSDTASPAPARRGPGRPRSVAKVEGKPTAKRAAAPAPAAKATTSAPAKKATSAPAKKTAAPAKKGKGGRLARRSPADIAKALASVVDLVKKTKGGLRAEQIRKQLGMEAKEMPRVLKEGLTKKVLKSKGEKRSTTYSAA